MTVSMALSCLVALGVLSLLLLTPRKREVAPSVSYRYRYQQHPFGEWHFFEVKAGSQDAANAIAIERFQEMFRQRLTVMTVFYPV